MGDAFEKALSLWSMRLRRKATIPMLASEMSIALRNLKIVV
jgi:hypothetical protein